MTDAELQKKGLEILAAGLGVVEAERFVYLLMKEPLDYTEWRKKAFGNLNLESAIQESATLWNKKHP